MGGVLVICAETTEQVLQADAKAQLQREELAHLSRVVTLSALSGSLAHELKQPLGSILLNAQAGQLCLSQDVPDLVELRANFADIVSAECRAEEIIHRLRTMLRRGEVALQPVSVNECLEELLRLTRSDLTARGIERCLADALELCALSEPDPFAGPAPSELLCGPPHPDLEPPGRRRVADRGP